MFVPLVAKSTKKTVVNISSTLGSIGTDLGEKFASYSVTKAALNMLVRRSGSGSGCHRSLKLIVPADPVGSTPQTYKQAKERPDITAISICPGHLQTGTSFGMRGRTASTTISC